MKAKEQGLSQYTSNPSLPENRKRYFINLEGKVLGRIAVRISQLLRGKNSINFNYNLDIGNFVTLINSDKVILTGKKYTDKKYYRHSGYPGSLREKSAGSMMKECSEKLVMNFIRGMMGHKNLSRKQLKRLSIYHDSNYKNKAQEKDFIIID